MGYAARVIQKKELEKKIAEKIAKAPEAKEQLKFSSTPAGQAAFKGVDKIGQALSSVPDAAKSAVKGNFVEAGQKIYNSVFSAESDKRTSDNFEKYQKTLFEDSIYGELNR